MSRARLDAPISVYLAVRPVRPVRTVLVPEVPVAAPEAAQVRVIDYDPHPAQRAVHASNKKIRVVSAGARGGKTKLLGPELLRYATERPGSVGLIVSPDYPMYMRDLHDPFLVPLLEGLAAYSRQDHVWRFTNGTTVWVMYAKDPDASRGLGVDWVLGDELREWPPEMWHILVTRMDRPWSEFLGVTTPRGHNWVVDTFQARAGQTWVRGRQETWADRDPEIAWFEWHTEDNTRAPGIAAVVARWKASLPSALYRQEAEASIETLTGVVYPDFSRTACVIDPIPIPAWWPKRIGIDFGAADPTAISGWALSPEGTLMKFAEWCEPNQPLSVHQAQAQAMIGDSHAVTLYAGSDAKQEILEFQQAGLPVQSAERDFLLRYSRLTDLMRAGRFAVFATCEQTIRAYELYRWPPLPSQGVPAAFKPLHAFSDLPDADGYALQTPWAEEAQAPAGPPDWTAELTARINREFDRQARPTASLIPVLRRY